MGSRRCGSFASLWVSADWIKAVIRAKVADAPSCRQQSHHLACRRSRHYANDAGDLSRHARAISSSAQIPPIRMTTSSQAPHICAGSITAMDSPNVCRVQWRPRQTGRLSRARRTIAERDGELYRERPATSGPNNHRTVGRWSCVSRDGTEPPPSRPHCRQRWLHRFRSPTGRTRHSLAGNNNTKPVGEVAGCEGARKNRLSVLR